MIDPEIDRLSTSRQIPFILLTTFANPFNIGLRNSDTPLLRTDFFLMSIGIIFSKEVEKFDKYSK